MMLSSVFRLFRRAFAWAESAEKLFTSALTCVPSKGS